MGAWEPSSMSKNLHAFPHVDLYMNLVKNYFDMSSDDYKTSLILIGIFPAVVVFLILTGFLLWRLAYEREDQNKIMCPCKMQSYFRIFSIVATVVVVIGLLFELMLHANGIKAKGFLASTDLLEIKDHVRVASKIDEPDYHINFRYPYQQWRGSTYALTALIKYEPTDDYYTYKEVDPYRKLHGTYMHRFMEVVAGIQNPPVENKPFETNRLNTLKNKEIKRFIFMLLLWTVGIVLAMASPHKYWVITLLGIVWCLVMICNLLVTMVGVADFCQDPITISAEVTDQEEMRDTIQKYLNHACIEFNDKANENKRQLKRTVSEWDRTFTRHRRDIEQEYAEYFWSFAGNWAMVRDNRYQFSRKTQEYFQEMRDNDGLNKYLKTVIDMECFHIDINDEDVMLENFSSLCDDDFTIWNLMMQLAMVSVALLIYIILFLIHGMRVHSFAYYVYVIKQIKFLRPPTPPASYSAMIAKLRNCGHIKCQRARVCKCLNQYKPKPPKKNREEKSSIKAAMNINEEEFATGQICYAAGT